MIDLSSGMDSLTNFKRNTPAFLEQLRDTGQPVVLTINGRAKVVVQDAAAYQDLLEQLDRLQAIEGIKKGLEDVAQGRTRPIDKVITAKRKKYGLQG